MSNGRCPMKRNPLKKALMLGAIVLGAFLVAPTQQDAEAHWRRGYRWGGPGYYSTWRAPVYGGYYYSAPSYYYTAPVYSGYYYGGYPAYGYYGGYPAYGYGGGYYSPGFSYYRGGWRSGWGFSVGF
jgi:hypothetical protein